MVDFILLILPSKSGQEQEPPTFTKTNLPKTRSKSANRRSSSSLCFWPAITTLMVKWKDLSSSTVYLAGNHCVPQPMLSSFRSPVDLPWFDRSGRRWRFDRNGRRRRFDRSGRRRQQSKIGRTGGDRRSVGDLVDGDSFDRRGCPDLGLGFSVFF
ncbi:hypothetical protein QJS04_geneDACA017560 [Acorus gramineus]|uniref:Uncharacterized protein n=1 Tax=Acorus gramineus TaxID=55184 RepID=A0AAV9BQ54_ACOGR|nr:hypothetical protein QJS04_geneDACA017560 [Acorus gramineus]